MNWINWLLRLLRGRVFPTTPTMPSGSLLEELNRVREEKGLPKFNESECLTQGAQSHAERMARVDRLSHDGWLERLDVCGFRYGSENVAQGQKSAKEAVSDWLTSPGHRRNVLSKEWTTVGVGNKELYWCVVFA